MSHIALHPSQWDKKTEAEKIEILKGIDRREDIATSGLAEITALLRLPGKVNKHRLRRLVSSIAEELGGAPIEWE